MHIDLKRESYIGVDYAGHTITSYAIQQHLVCSVTAVHQTRPAGLSHLPPP